MNEPKAKLTTFEELLAQDGRFVYTNVGCSMLPLLRQRRDIIEIRTKGTERCKKYDVVLYKRGGKYILHRVLKVMPKGYWIAGDNCAFMERDVTDDMILGIMTRVRKNGKNITTNSFRYRCYVHLWCDCYPLRFFILRALKWVWALGHKMKTALKKV